MTLDSILFSDRYPIGLWHCYQYLHNCFAYSPQLICFLFIVHASSDVYLSLWEMLVLLRFIERKTISPCEILPEIKQLYENKIIYGTAICLRIQRAFLICGNVKKSICFYPIT